MLTDCSTRSHLRQVSNPITVKQLAEVLGVNPRSVQRMVQRGELTPSVKLPGRTGAYLFDDPGDEA
jgi:excisionase family DNA binding protein